MMESINPLIRLKRFSWTQPRVRGTIPGDGKAISKEMNKGFNPVVF